MPRTAWVVVYHRRNGRHRDCVVKSVRLAVLPPRSPRIGAKVDINTVAATDRRGDKDFSIRLRRLISQRMRFMERSQLWYCDKVYRLGARQGNPWRHHRSRHDGHDASQFYFGPCSRHGAIGAVHVNYKPSKDNIVRQRVWLIESLPNAFCGAAYLGSAQWNLCRKQ